MYPYELSFNIRVAIMYGIPEATLLHVICRLVDESIRGINRDESQDGIWIKNSPEFYSKFLGLWSESEVLSLFKCLYHKDAIKFICPTPKLEYLTQGYTLTDGAIEIYGTKKERT